MRRTRRIHTQRRGAILIIALMVGLMVAMAVAAAMSTAVTTSKHSQFSLNLTEATALAEGVTEAVQKEMLTKVANFQTFALSGNVSLGGQAYPFAITPIGAAVNRVDIDGVTMAIQSYELLASADVDTGSAAIRRIVDLTMTPLFQYMIFYNDDLEILPGPNMILEGRVHANADIYVGSGATLTVDSDYFRCTGDILRERKNDGSTSTGTVDIKVYSQETYAAMTTSMDSSHADWVSLALDTWAGTVQSGAHGVKEVAAPQIATIKATDPATGGKGYYHANADLVIRDNQAFDKNGLAVSLPPGTITQKSFYDGRENRTVTVTDVNISLLNGSGNFPANGLIYAYRTDASASQPNGIRLTDASELAAPLMVVTEDPIYIKGDFNTVNKKGAAVMADAVNLLSNAWNDSKTAGSLPGAAATQYNLAMVTGNVPTPDGGGSYSGGFENLPRFHENWSGVTATIRGSFIKIFESEIAKGLWEYGGDVYTAPNRDWRYDPDLLNMANMPPFTPNAVYFRRVLWDDSLPLPF
jgi:hypothetical protein